MKTTWKKGLALLGGVMVLLMNLVPSAVVFAEDANTNLENNGTEPSSIDAPKREAVEMSDIVESTPVETEEFYNEK